MSTYEKFTALCSAFSAFSYIDFGSSLKKQDAVACAVKSLKYDRVNQSPDDLLFDLCTSVSITVEEGGQISYIHRSIQEYLTAVFFANREFEGWGDRVEMIYKKNSQDNVILLLSEINPEKFQKNFLRPRLKEIVADVASIDPSQPVEIFNLFYFTMGVQKEGSIVWTIGIDHRRKKWTYLLSILEQLSLISRPNHLKDFPWQNFLKTNFSDSVIDNYDGLEITKMSNAIIKQTPLNSYLLELIEKISSIESEFEKAEQEKKALLSDLFLADQGIKGEGF